MSIKVIERMTHYCKGLLIAFKSGNAKKIAKWLEELEKENKRELNSVKELKRDLERSTLPDIKDFDFKLKYPLILHGNIENAITIIKQNINDPKKCIEQARIILDYLENIVNQREVRDQLIKEVIHPILKSWGYKKKARAFVKKEGEKVIRVNVYTNRFCSYYDVSFSFEINAKGPETDVFGVRPGQKWFELNEDTDIKKIKAEIKDYLLNVVKPFLDKI